MGFLQRIVNSVCAAPEPGVGTPAAPKAGAGTYTVGQFLRRRAAAGWAVPAAPGVFASGAPAELNTNWPEAGSDPALDAQAPVDAGPNTTARHAATEAREVTGNSERRAASSKQRLHDSLEARLSSDDLIPGNSVERSERSVSDTDAKDASENGTARTVHTDLPSLLPATYSHVARAVDGGPASSLSTAVAGIDPAPAAGATSSAGPASLAVESHLRLAPLADLVADRGAGGSTRYQAALQAGGDVVVKVPLRASTDAPAFAAPHGGGATLASDDVPATPAAASPLPAAGMAEPAFTVTLSTTAEAKSASHIDAARTSPEPPGYVAGPRREASIAPEPVVQIGNIEIIVEAPAEPRAASRGLAPATDFASRHYLRGL